MDFDDFSDILKPGEANKAVAEYYARVCSRCGGLCCSFNTSPVMCEFSLAANLEDENIIILKKALILHADFKNRFHKNITASIKYFQRLGIGKKALSLLREKKFSLPVIVQIYRLLDRQIKQYNKKVYRVDRYDMRGRAYSDCLFLIPGKGCIMEEYRPYTCKTAFRKCFPLLKLSDYVQANTLTAAPGRLYEYIKSCYQIDPEIALPRIIVGAKSELKKKLSRLLKDHKPATFKKLSYYQLAQLADFISFPFMKVPRCMDDLIDYERFYIMGNIKDPPPLILVDEIYPGTQSKDFDFGLDYVQLFKVAEYA